MTTLTRRAAPPRIDSDKPDDWRDSGLCRDENPELFFPLGGENGHRRSGVNLLQEEEAKKVCNRCPVRVECREWALGSGEEFGVWGGLNENERRSLRRCRAVSGV